MISTALEVPMRWPPVDQKFWDKENVLDVPDHLFRNVLGVFGSVA